MGSTETLTADEKSDDEEWNRPSDDDVDCETQSDRDTEDCKIPADGYAEEDCDGERRDRESS